MRAKMIRTLQLTPTGTPPMRPSRMFWFTGRTSSPSGPEAAGRLVSRSQPVRERRRSSSGFSPILRALRPQWGSGPVRGHGPPRRCGRDATVSDGTRPQAAGDRRPAELVDTVRLAVAAHDPADGREAEARERILTELGQLARPFDVEADRTHVTGSAIVVGRRGTVLHMHKRLHRWMQPGGHLDPGESPWEAALRESEEETGLSLRHPDSGPRLVHVDVHPAADGHVHL